MIKKLFSGQINSITLAALLVALSSLVSRILGIFRDRILAGEFGAGDMLDSYYAAFRFPDLIFNLLVLGALSAGFIPIFTQLVKKFDLKEIFAAKKNNEAWMLVNNVINSLGIILIVLAVIGFIFSPELMKLTVPKFSPEKQAMAAMLSRIMFLSPFFLGLSSVIGGVLQSFKRFFVYSLSPIFYNVGIIIGALYLVPKFGISGLAWGVVLGSFLHFIIQIPTAINLGYRYELILNWKESNLRKIMSMMLPRTMSLAISQINLFITTIIASALAGGSLAIFNFANNLQSFPLGIFAISYAVAAFPAMSSVAFDRGKLKDIYSQTLRQILFFIVPSTILLLALRAQIIRVVLGSGKFDWNATVLTLDTLGFFTISLFAQALIPLQVRMFYARRNSSKPFYIGLVSAGINTLLSYYFSRKMGVAGLALAFSIANILNFIILWVALKFEVGNLDESKIAISSFKFFIAGSASAFAIQGAKILIEPYLNMTKFWGIAAQAIIAASIGIAVYFAFCSLLKSEEFIGFWRAIKRRIGWSKVEVGDQGEARGI